MMQVMNAESNRKRMLVILAHPDDESFGPGGTLAKYAAAGVDVHYLCGTRGESGSVDADKLSGFSSVAELRTAELACAGQRLGLAGVHYLGFRDSGMQGSPDNAHADSLHQAPLDVVAERILDYVDQFKPDVIMTHDQFGGYGHPDHIKLHLGVLRAYELRYGVRIDVQNWGGGVKQPTLNVSGTSAVAPPLYFTSISKTVIRMGVKLMPLIGRNPREFGRNKDIDLVKIASWEVPTTTTIDTRAFLRIKDAASACHVSQQPPSQGPLLVRLLFRMNAGREVFSRVYPHATTGLRETAFLGL
jgi:LmbE family N-acetylglucosaminyl deacetylase